MTVLELVERCRARLEAAGVSFGHGTGCAFDEAAWLVLWGLGCPLDALDEVADKPVDPGAARRCEALVAQRIESRLPAAYLTGEAWLQGVPFHVDARTIIPRSYIAELIAQGTLEPWLPAEPSRILDLCTGNGSLAVLAAMAWPAAQVDATDLSGPALEVASRNVARHALGAQIALRQGDGLAAASGPYDLILCNPPYVTRASMACLPPSVSSSSRPRLRARMAMRLKSSLRPISASRPAASAWPCRLPSPSTGRRWISRPAAT